MDCFCPRYLASWSSSARAKLWYSIATWLIMHAHVGDTLLPNEILNFTANKLSFSRKSVYKKGKKRCQWYFVTKIVLTYCEITRTIYSKREMSEQFLVTECFLEFKLKKRILGFRNMQNKLENNFTKNFFSFLLTFFNCVFIFYYPFH